MAILSVHLPTPEEEDRTRRFQVQKNYLLGLAQYLENEYGAGTLAGGEALIRDLRQQRGFARIQRVADADKKACATALSLSWSGIIQLELASWSKVQFSLPYTNAWAPVHAYYAVSGAARAWLTSQGQPTTSHATTLKAIGSEVQGRHLYPPPWDVFCSGCCHDGSHSFQHAPPGETPANSGVLLSNPDLSTFWSRYLKMLETTRRHSLDRRFDEWKRQQGKKRMLQSQKQAVAAAVPPTTLFDFLWRLRVRSNYHGVEPYLMTHVAPGWQRDFYDSIRLVAHHSSLMFDCWVARRLGSAWYADTIGDFMQYREHSPEPVRFLEARREWLGAKGGES